MTLTVDGVGVYAGLRVFTNDCRWGTAVKVAWREHEGQRNEDAWWAVEEDNHGIVHINGERMCSRDMIGGTIDEDAELQRKQRESAERNKGRWTD
jgi:hypothetical protein